MGTSKPKVLALAYYDGATEGFCAGIEPDKIYFFKVIAWDRNQDRRLYLLGQVETSMYLELLEILADNDQSSKGMTWVPNWTFRDTEKEVRANNLVEASKRSLDTAELLVLGEDLTGKVELIRPNAEVLFRAIAMAQESGPSDLASWQTQ